MDKLDERKLVSLCKAVCKVYDTTDDSNVKEILDKHLEFAVGVQAVGVQNNQQQEETYKVLTEYDKETKSQFIRILKERGYSYGCSIEILKTTADHLKVSMEAKLISPKRVENPLAHDSKSSTPSNFFDISNKAYELLNTIQDGPEASRENRIRVIFNRLMEQKEPCCEHGSKK